MIDCTILVCIIDNLTLCITWSQFKILKLVLTFFYVTTEKEIQKVIKETYQMRRKPDKRMER